MHGHDPTIPDDAAASPIWHPFLPLPALVGNADAKQALLLLAIDRNLKGILITSRAGCGKTSIARAARTLFPRLLQIPTAVSDDQLLGGLDLEHTLRSGIPYHRTGLLARANRGALWVDDVNLMGERQRYTIAAALDEGIVRLERAGLSRTAEADFVFIGSYNSSEAEIDPHLRDRVGLVIAAEDLNSDDERILVLRRSLEFGENSPEVVARYQQALAVIRDQVAEARSRLPEIPITSDDARRIAEAGLLLGVEGNRADFFALRAARAQAALSRDGGITDDDLTVAIRYVLLPRATTFPPVRNGEVEKQGDPKEEEKAAGQDEKSRNRNDERAKPNDEEGEANRGTSRLPVEDLIIRAIDAQMPPAEVTDAFKVGARRGRGSSGKRYEQARNDHGRQVAALAKKYVFSRIAVVPTLMAAAPFQAIRRRANQKLSGEAIRITPDDLRYARRKARSGMLFILAVDASGSMAINRMAQAKGAMTRLLSEAYVHRDKVALISFRRQRAEVVLAPTRSVELAKRVVDALPAGGATPIAAALLKSIEVVERARSQGMAQAMIVLFSDGRANVGSAGGGNRDDGPAIKDELRRLGAALQAKEIPVLIIDTKPQYILKNDAGELAGLLGAQYRFLPRANEKTVYRQIKELASTS